MDSDKKPQRRNGLPEFGKQTQYHVDQKKNMTLLLTEHVLYNYMNVKIKI
jgi:hypothetical protein